MRTRLPMGSLLLHSSGRDDKGDQAVGFYKESFRELPDWVSW